LKPSDYILSSALIFGLAGGSLYVAVRGAEYWPFSAVKMYSSIDRSHDLRWCGIYGLERVAGSSSYVEHYISKEDYFWPLTDPKLCIGLQRQTEPGHER
jgi:hypothetical protein